MKKICVLIGSRANYSSIKNLLYELKKNRKIKLILIVFSSAVLDKYGRVADIIKKDGFKINEEIYNHLDGETPLTMSKSTGLAIIELSSSFLKHKPDIVLTIGDRYETMATAISATYLNIPLAHTMGGEVSGTIDESIRHAITKFSHIHFPASRDAYNRILRLGENKKNVFLVGCPRIDEVKKILNQKISINTIEKSLYTTGVGKKFHLNQKFLLFSQHPVTTEYYLSDKHIKSTLLAIKKINLPTIGLWPNADAGSAEMSKVIRKFREIGFTNNIYFFKNLDLNIYINLMNLTSCLIGNSSSAIREGAYIGTPSVNIGTRQNGRERAKNVIDCNNDSKNIFKAINKQIQTKKYKSSNIYGDGNSAKKISKILSKIKVDIQKKITY